MAFTTTLYCLLLFVLPSFIIKLLVDKICARGDGKGGTDTYIGKANDREDCVSQVKASKPNANGATFKDCDKSGSSICSGYKNCFAEFEMNGWDDKEDFESCLFAGKIFS